MGVKISNLPAIETPALTDVFPVVQAGVTYKETFTQLTGLFANAPLNTNITSMTGLTGAIEAPTSISSASGDPVLGFIYTASSVNYINLINSVTLNTPILVATGSDANIGLTIAAKGNGQILLNSTNNAPVAFASGTAGQHSTVFSFANTAVQRTITFPDANGTVAFTGTLVTGNVIMASSAFNVVDAGFALLANTTTAWGGGGVSNAFTATGIGATSIVTATILASTNAVSIVKAVPTANTLTVTFSGDPGAATQVSWIAITPAV